MSRLKSLLPALLLALPATLLVAPPAEASVTTVWAKVTRWVDGDTVETSRGKVRLIGVDTPETGTCGAARATQAARALAPVGGWIRLGNPSSVRDKDRYGRLLRYADKRTSSGAFIDVSRRQIRLGARARYDSRDGYDWHPRQSAYRSTDASYPNYGCTAGEVAAYPPASPSTCPASAPIKGNQDSWIYHMPWNRYYDVTNPEQCFATRQGAERAGYRAAQV